MLDKYSRKVHQKMENFLISVSVPGLELGSGMNAYIFESKKPTLKSVFRVPPFLPPIIKSTHTNSVKFGEIADTHNVVI